MPQLKIDHRDVTVPEGATVLDAAKKLGIDVPTLCYLDGCRASTSCLVCMVRDRRSGRLSPACGTPAVDGMDLESETDEVRQVRRAALELLLSDHLGDCLAPCFFACPAQMDIPTMLRQIVAGDLRGAIATVKANIALPATLGRVCPAPCEKACRRAASDGAVAICLLKRHVADVDLASNSPYRGELPPLGGQRVAIVGGGATGLAAAYYLRRGGHACVLFEEQQHLGGRLRDEPELPAAVLDAEIATLLLDSIEVRTAAPLAANGSALDALRSEFDAVLLACGAAGKTAAPAWGLAVTPRGIQADTATFATGRDGVFAAGCALRGKAMIVRSAADGKEAAVAIGQYLSGAAVTGAATPFTTRMGRLEPEEVRQMHALSAIDARQPPASPAEGYSVEEAATQAARCLHCDCRALTTCKLRRYADEYGTDPRRYKARRRPFLLDMGDEVVFEPGKCIDCGLCIQIAEAAGEPLGLTFVGRGFEMRVAAPLHRALRDALQKAAAACIAACPTAALAWRREPR